jgi:CCR4-NOT transcriptional regulation complex NOT5 subunit
MSLFSEETLFFIFYSMPKDALQVSAAAELCALSVFSGIH